jgi:hypothetical protein
MNVFYYFEKPPFIKFNELFAHHLNDVFLFTKLESYEIGIISLCS